MHTHTHTHTQQLLQVMTMLCDMFLSLCAHLCESDQNSTLQETTFPSPFCFTSSGPVVTHTHARTHTHTHT